MSNDNSNIEDEFKIPINMESLLLTLGSKYFQTEIMYWLEKTILLQGGALTMLFYKTNDCLTLEHTLDKEIIAKIFFDEFGNKICQPIRLMRLKSEKIIDEYYKSIGEIDLKDFTFYDRLITSLPQFNGNELFLYYYGIIVFNYFALNNLPFAILEFNKNYLLFNVVAEKYIIQNDGSINISDNIMTFELNNSGIVKVNSEGETKFYSFKTFFEYV